ncbi:MAG: FMN-binding negative transcriptional regulator [Vulcanimicrobiaceae bacterium]
MYVPAHFRVKDPRAALTLIADYPFGTAISVVDGTPVVSHLPFTIVRREPEVVLAAHCARANPHWRHLEASDLLVIFQGIHGYISPRWYADRRRAVPTWNYASVHCTGTARIAAAHDADAILHALVQDMERGNEHRWSIHELEPEYKAAMKNGIVPFYVTVKAIDAQFKFSQNRNATDRAGVIEGLRGSHSEAGRFLAHAIEAACVDSANLWPGPSTNSIAPSCSS